jgi:hypothetical protein
MSSSCVAGDSSCSGLQLLHMIPMNREAGAHGRGEEFIICHGLENLKIVSISDGTLPRSTRTTCKIKIKKSFRASFCE